MKNIFSLTKVFPMRAMLAECIMRIHPSHHVIAIRANVAGSTMSLPSAGTFNLIKEQICNMKYVTRITGALSLQKSTYS